MEGKTDSGGDQLRQKRHSKDSKKAKTELQRQPQKDK
jgi:hypothetical protein